MERRVKEGEKREVSAGSLRDDTISVGDFGVFQFTVFTSVEACFMVEEMRFLKR